MRFYKRLFIISLTLSIALPLPLFTTTFDPNFLISDEELQNWQSMNREDIQAFLSDKGGYIANFTAADKNGIERPVSDIIYRAAVDNKINPKYLLVKLQKEQSLITDQDPTPKQLDWATGYGVCDSCSMDDPNIQKFKGFGVQVDNAAGIMRWYYDNVNNQGWIKRPANLYLIDNSPVTPANFATAFLYTYTPHLHGNLNFWNLWQKWFDQVYPDASLIKTTDDPTVYLLQDGQKRKFTSMTALTTRFNPKLILTVPQSELVRYPDGKDISLPNYSIVTDGTNYYLIDYGYKRQFANREVVRQIGYNPDEIITVTPEDLQGYESGKIIEAETTAPLGRIIEIRESKNQYFVEDGVMHPIFDPALLKINFSHLALEKIPSAEFSTMNLTFGDPVLLKDGTVFGIKGSHEIYVVEKGKKRHIASEDVFNGLGYAWNNIVWVNEYLGMALTPGEPIYLKTSPKSSTPKVAGLQIQAPDVVQSTQPSTLDLTVPTTQTVKQPVDYMVRTKPDHVSFIGENFDTPIDSYLVADYNTGEIVAGKNVDTVRPLASLSKLMTAEILMKEKLPLDKTTTYTATKDKSNYHNFNVAEGDQLLNNDILYSMLIGSNNTASAMLVDSLGYTMNNFASRMNTEAQNLGLSHVSFVESYGYDPRNQGTPREVVTLFREALKNDTIQKVLSTPRYSYDEVYSTDATITHTEIHTNKLIKRTDLPYRILASKTGFLYESGSCLIMLVERNSDGKQFVLLTMGNPDFGTDSRFTEPARIASWALTSF